MSRQSIHTERAPQAIGPYSQAVRAGDTVYLSGQVPFDPATMQLVSGDIEVQVRRIVPQQAVADGMEGAGPAQSLLDCLADTAQGFVECLPGDVVSATPHFGRRAARECQQQYSRGIDTVHDQVRHPVRQRVCFASAGAGHGPDQPPRPPWPQAGDVAR